ncbi:cytochrome P450 [Streptomyces albus]|uniref:Cytochrome P450 n=1 Tax=Streptomyces albus (strain ATCC 21838 / DSM 41398 / FERM P-419 / JCM 4703 / NBRC 107858) TaxID=1081613 RepID=A0A0B5FA73_STRA4|nr:cytochrome P450 [Streptomyces albus]AOU81665.1 cytochrome P450 [Streptomyces albus]AYN37354.1 cytochrome P450 [Streptomyces albus]
MTTTVRPPEGGACASGHGAPLPFAGKKGLLGHAKELQQDTIGALHRLSETAENGVLGFRIGSSPAVVVSSAATAREVLIDRADDFGRGKRQTRALTPLMGRGLLTSEGELHSRQRRLVLPHFSPRRVPKHADAIVAVAEETVRRWSEGVDVDLVAEMNALTMDIVTKLLFSTSTRDNQTIASAITEAFEWEMHAITSVFALPMWAPTPRNRRARAAIETFRNWIAGFIRERRTADELPEDILSDLMGARYEDGGTMTEDLLLDEVLTAWGAAQETSADAQAWTLYLLARHPEAMARVHEEVDSVLGGRSVTFEDLARLPYCLQVFKEAMRLFPPAAVIPRQALKDTVIGGYTVPAGTMVFLNTFSLHRRPEVFPDPERFDPDRFTREREKAQPKGGYLPFGTGGNICPGSHLAMMEGHLLTALLNQRMRYELLPQGAEVRPELLVNLRPDPGVRAHVSPR